MMKDGCNLKNRQESAGQDTNVACVSSAINSNSAEKKTHLLSDEHSEDVVPQFGFSLELENLVQLTMKKERDA